MSKVVNLQDWDYNRCEECIKGWFITRKPNPKCKSNDCVGGPKNPQWVDYMNGERDSIDI